MNCAHIDFAHNDFPMSRREFLGRFAFGLVGAATAIASVKR